MEKVIGEIVIGYSGRSFTFTAERFTYTYTEVHERIVNRYVNDYKNVYVYEK